MNQIITNGLIDFLQGEVSNVSFIKSHDNTYHFTAIDVSRDNVPVKLIVTEGTALYNVEMTINGSFVDIGGFNL